MENNNLKALLIMMRCIVVSLFSEIQGADDHSDSHQIHAKISITTSQENLLPSGFSAFPVQGSAFPVQGSRNSLSVELGIEKKLPVESISLEKEEDLNREKSDGKDDDRTNFIDKMLQDFLDVKNAPLTISLLTIKASTVDSWYKHCKDRKKFKEDKIFLRPQYLSVLVFCDRKSGDKIEAYTKMSFLEFENKSKKEIQKKVSLDDSFLNYLYESYGEECLLCYTNWQVRELYYLTAKQEMSKDISYSFSRNYSGYKEIQNEDGSRDIFRYLDGGFGRYNSVYIAQILENFCKIQPIFSEVFYEGNYHPLSLASSSELASFSFNPE